MKLFRETLLPAVIVRPFALSLVFVETAVGVLIVLGLWTRSALLVGALSVAYLVFGTALRPDWNTLAIQMLYTSIYTAVIAAPAPRIQTAPWCVRGLKTNVVNSPLLWRECSERREPSEGFLPMAAGNYRISA